jgi:hypothetical protein
MSVFTERGGTDEIVPNEHRNPLDRLVESDFTLVIGPTNPRMRATVRDVISDDGTRLLRVEAEAGFRTSSDRMPA